MTDPADTPEIRSWEDVAALLDGHTDDEVTSAVTELGTDETIAQIADVMVEWLRNARSGIPDAIVQCDITAPEGIHTFHLTIADGTFATDPGPGHAPTVSLELALADFLRLVTGRLNGLEAFLSGTLKLSGDLILGQQMQSWFTV